MRHVNCAGRRSKFSVLLDSGHAQAAVMVLRPGESSSDQPEDEHPRSEQWLLVISGRGQARVPKKRPVPLKAHSLLLIDKGEPHQITCTGRAPMVTLNLYVPPAYTPGGDVRWSAKMSLSSLLKSK